MEHASENKNRKRGALLIPLLAAALIALSALVLWVSISTSQAKANAESVTATIENDVAAPVVDDIVMAAISSDPAVTSPPNYTVQLTSLSGAANDQIPQSAISINQSAAIGAKYFEQIFGVSIDGTIFVSYYKPDFDVNGYFSILAGGKKEEEAKYSCSINAVTGELHSARQMNPRTSSPGESSPGEKEKLQSPSEAAMVDRALMDSAMDDPIYREKAETFIRKHFLNGRNIVETQTTAVQWGFGTDYDMIVDVRVHVDTGASYCISYSYPGYDIFMLEVFPLGWHSCWWGYQSPEEADYYPGLDGSPAKKQWETATGIEPVIESPPLPTPQPTPN